MTENHHKSSPGHSSVSRGFALGISASLLWGLSPIFFKLMGDFMPIEIVTHRIIWTVLAMSAFAYWTGKMVTLRMALTNWHEIKMLAIGSALMTINWFVFIYAIETNNIIDASLGYYIYPLMVAAVGVFGLGEKLTRRQKIAVALAAIGVAVKSIDDGGIPTIALIVAVTFTLYTMVGKIRKTEAAAGLLAESIIAMPFALGFLIYLFAAGNGQFITGGSVNTSLAIATGLVTALPLAMYMASSRAIGMAVTGLLFYITPTLHLLVGVIIYGEPFSQIDGLAFGFIWLALGFLVWRKR